VTVRLQADDPEVLALTRTAVEGSLGQAPTIKVRCASCGTVVGHAGHTTAGPLFIATWTVPIAGATATEDGRLLRRQERHPGAERTGQLDTEDVHSTIALVALPPEMVEDYPDLMVRCMDHRDALVDRVEVVGALRAGKDLHPTVAFPRIEYVIPDSTWLAGLSSAEARRQTTTTRWGQPGR